MIKNYGFITETKGSLCSSLVGTKGEVGLPYLDSVNIDEFIRKQKYQDYFPNNYLLVGHL